MKTWLVLAIVLVTSTGASAQDSLKPLAEALSRREREMRRYDMHWQWELTYMSSSRPTVADKADWQDCALHVAPFQHGWVVSVTRHYSSAPLEKETYENVLLIQTPTGYIGQEGGPGALVATPLGFRVEISLLPILLLSGLNPLRYAEPSSISISRDRRYLRVDATLLAELWRSAQPEQITIWLDTTRSLAPAKVVWASTSMSGEASVSTFVRQGSVWVPRTFNYTVSVGTVPRERLVYKLGRVEKASNQHPTWLREGEVISDWRLGLGESNLVWYPFRSWRLPTKSELLRLQSEQSAPTSPYESEKQRGSLFRLVPSTLLIVISALWYWRLRRRERA